MLQFVLQSELQLQLQLLLLPLLLQPAVASLSAASLAAPADSQYARRASMGSSPTAEQANEPAN